MIRTATVKDLPAILEIMNYAILHTTAVYDYAPRLIEYIQLWFDEKQEKDFPVLVAEIENKVCGYSTYSQLKDKEGYKFCVEHSVYVTKGYNGKGIGTALLQELIKIAKAKGKHSMVGIVDADNTNSIAFHEKLGFVKSGVLLQAGYKFNRWLDVQYMQLMLS